MSERLFNGRTLMKHDTTANWMAAATFIPKAGEIIVYDDYATKIIDGVTINVPNFKIGDGLAYCVDLPWVNEDVRSDLQSHINNLSIHVSSSDRSFWNNKIRIDDDFGEVIDDTLAFTIY